MSIKPTKYAAMKPRIVVIGVGGGGGNAVNNMLAAGLDGPKFVVANTDAQALELSSAEHRIQLGARLTEGIGAGAKHEIGEAAAEEALEEIREALAGAHMVFIAAGMGGGTGTGAAPVIARVAKQEFGILTVGVVTKPFLFEGKRRMRIAEAGINELKRHVDTLLVIPNQNLFKVATERTPFAEAFVLADQVLYSGVACIVDLVVKDGLINLDLADVKTVLSGMGTAMMGTGEASGEGRAVIAAREAIHNPLLEDVVLRGAKSLLLSISGGSDLTLFEVDDAVDCIREELDGDANVIFGATLDETMVGKIRVSIVASGMPRAEPKAQPDWPPGRHQRPQGAPHGTMGGPAPGSDYRHVLSRAMSAPEAADGADAGQGDPWRTPGGDVVIREGPPQLPGQAPPASGQAGGRGAHAGAGAWGRHVPNISEFPLVAQREYLAKAGDGRRPPPAYDQQPEASAPRTSLLQRLRGGVRGKHPQVAEAHPPATDEMEEDPDVPPFFRPGTSN